MVRIEKASENEPIFPLHPHDELAKVLNEVLRAQDKLAGPATEIYRLLASLHKGQIVKTFREVPALEMYLKTLRLVSLLWENYRQRIIQAEELQELATSQKLRESSIIEQEHTKNTRKVSRIR